MLKGIALRRARAFKEVAVSTDGGKDLDAGQLGRDLGKYSFREWKLPFKLAAGAHELKVRASSNGGDVQADDRRSGIRPVTCATSSKPFAFTAPEGMTMHNGFSSHFALLATRQCREGSAMSTPRRSPIAAG